MSCFVDMVLVFIGQEKTEVLLKKSEVTSDEQPKPSSRSTTNGKGMYLIFKFWRPTTAC